MHSLHADDSPALPTRRSRRETHATSPSLAAQGTTRRERNYPAAHPTAEEISQLPSQPLTRAQIRESRLVSSTPSARLATPPAANGPSISATSEPLTRAQLRALAQGAQTPASASTQPQSGFDLGNTRNVIDEVRAVVAEVERRVSVAETAPTTHEMLVLSQGAEQLVDTNAPGCDVHGTSQIVPVEVFPGTSIAVSPVAKTAVVVSEHRALADDNIAEATGSRVEPAVQPFDFDAALGLSQNEHDYAPVSRRTQHGNTRMGALARVAQPARDDASNRARNQWASRVAVLSTIGLATIGAPLLANGAEVGSIQASDGAIDLEASPGPTTIEFLNEAQQRSDIPNSIALSITEDERAVLVASRSDDRGTLDNCDGSVQVTSGNGLLGSSELCTVMGVQIQPEAAIAFTELNKAFTARFGHEMCITSGYRSLAQQYSVKAQKGSLAATPGRSNHGFGNAVDLCPTSYQSIEKWNWLHENAPTFGWDLPGWASRSYEPWHWEYTSGVEATNAY